MDVVEIILVRIVVLCDNHFAQIVNVVAAVADFNEKALVLAAQRCHVFGKTPLLRQRLSLLTHQLLPLKYSHFLCS